MTFRRVLKLLSLVLGFLAGLAAVAVAYFSRRMVAPARQALWTTPYLMGLDFENVQFPAQDGVRLSGWFLPVGAANPTKGTIIFAHGWLWNRLGDAAVDLAADISGTTPVELMRLAHALHYEGYNILMFDLRNHGESASHPPVTFGQSESYDLLGALAYLQGRTDVDGDRIGVIGFSMGANALLYALPLTHQIRAAIAVQPSTAAVYADGYSEDLLGVSGKILLPIVKTIYSLVGGIRLSALQPAFAVAGAEPTPVLFIQCREDKWGSVADVERLRLATPGGEGPLYVEGSHRYRGYQYIIENPHVAFGFFDKHFK
ncbi:MAG: alpha/beta fold hydrolase [Candidatus Promineofilum sp.]|nr:alpha/beta fold hydrolase [Promineifilum sp.]MBP9657873.1 alpha/beta fold hydrolase [Promineifilum sp.]